MELSSLILAQDDGSNLPKIIFGLIFFLIWTLSAFVSWLNKKQQEAKRQAAQARDRMPAQAAAALRQPQRRPPQRIAEGIAQRFPDVLLPPAPPPLPQPQQRRPIPPPSMPALKPPRRTVKAPQRRAAFVPPALPTAQIAPSALPSVNITLPAPRAKAPALDAVAVKHWLTPATLRQQFILTEILHPPLALRADPNASA